MLHIACETLRVSVFNKELLYCTGMCASLFQTYSIESSTVGYGRVQMLSAAAYRFAARYFVVVVVVNSTAT